MYIQCMRSFCSFICILTHCLFHSLLCIGYVNFDFYLLLITRRVSHILCLIICTMFQLFSLNHGFYLMDSYHS